MKLLLLDHNALLCNRHLKKQAVVQSKVMVKSLGLQIYKAMMLSLTVETYVQHLIMCTV